MGFKIKFKPLKMMNKLVNAVTNPKKTIEKGIHDAMDTAKEVYQKPGVILDAFTAGGMGKPLIDAAKGPKASDILNDMPDIGEPPDAQNEETKRQMAEAEDKERKRARGGRASTLLTGPRGLMDQATTARRTLLGS